MLGIGSIAKKVFGTSNDRKVKATLPTIEKINALEPEFQTLTDEGLMAKTQELKKRVAEGEALDDVLPEAFANCREAAKRALGLRAFDVQLMGGIFLHQGNIAEMKTGEGKTLVATFPAYLNALTGNSVHIVTATSSDNHHQVRNSAAFRLYAHAVRRAKPPTPRIVDRTTTGRSGLVEPARVITPRIASQTAPTIR